MRRLTRMMKMAGSGERLREVLRRLARRGRRLAGGSRSFSGGDMPVFFIVGRARSGTTWLRSILNSHPEILCWGEGRFFERSFALEDVEESQLNNIPPSSLYGAIMQSKQLKEWVDRSVWARGKDTDDHLAGLTRAAIDYFLAEQLSGTGKRMIGDKTPFVSAEVLEEIGVIYPEARVIHIIRDGRDVAVSMIHHMWSYARSEGGIYDLKPEELEKRHAYREGLVPPSESLFTEERLAGIASAWSTEVGRAAGDGPALLGGNYTEVRYEDLLQRPVEETQRLLKFLGAEGNKATAGSGSPCVV